MGPESPGTHDAPACLRLSVLGTFRAERDGLPIPDAAWQRPTARTLLKLLAIQPGHRLHQEQILDLLWPDLSPQSSLGSLRKSTTLARQALEPDLPRRAPSTFVHLVDGVLSLDPGTVRVDADEFEVMAQTALGSDQEAAYRDALAVYRDELLPEDRYEDWVLDRREALAQLHMDLLLGLADLLDLRGAPGEAVDHLHRALRHDPVREDVHRRLMRLHVASGNRHQALRQYQHCRQILQSELDVEPEPETIALYEEISSGRLSPVPVPLPLRLDGSADVPLPLVIRRIPRNPLVGRERPLQVISTELSHVMNNADPGARPGMMLIGGEAGVGKTRLTLEAARMAHDSGALVLWGGSYEQEGRAPYSALVEALEEYLREVPEEERESIAASNPDLAQLLPSLARSDISLPELDANPTGHDIGQLRLFSAVVRFLSDLAAMRPVLLVFDDLHVADPATLQLLHHVARAASAHQWLILGVYRTEDVRAGGDFEQLQISLSRESLCRHIDLLRLSRGDCAALVASLLSDGTPQDELVDHIYELSLGNALFTQELIETMQEQGVVLDDGSWHEPTERVGVPPKIRDLIVARTSHLSKEAQSVLSLAAASGMQSEFAVLRLASTLDDGALLDACDQALDAHILEERGDTFAFHHPLLRAAIYERLSNHRRSHLHAALAEAHRAVGASRSSDEYVETIAYHYDKASAPEAAEWLERAGDRAAAIYAADAAIQHYEQARRRLEGSDERLLARLDEKIGRVLSSVGRHDEALDVLERALTTVSQTRDLEAAGRITAAIGMAHRWRGTPQEGIDQVEPMIALLTGKTPSRAYASLHLTLANLFLLVGRYTAMLEATEEASRISRAIGDQALLAQSEERKGAALLLLNRPEEGQRIIEGVLPLIETTNDLLLLRTALNNAGCAAAFLSQRDRQHHFMERALELAERVGDPGQISFVLGNLGNSLMEAGDWEAARGYLNRAVELARSGRQDVNFSAALSQRGQLAIEEGEWESAACFLQEALSVAEATGNVQAQEQAKRALAQLDIWEGRARSAIARLERQTGEADMEVSMLPVLAWAFLEAGDIARAERVAEDAVNRLRLEWPQGLSDALWVQGRMLVRRGHVEEARDAFAEGLDLARDMPTPYTEARILHEMGILAFQCDKHGQARSRWEEALVIFRRLGARKDIERTERALAGLAVSCP